jgi:hypothetical protein
METLIHSACRKEIQHTIYGQYNQIVIFNNVDWIIWSKDKSGNSWYFTVGLFNCLPFYFGQIRFKMTELPFFSSIGGYSWPKIFISSASSVSI